MHEPRLYFDLSYLSDFHHGSVGVGGSSQKCKQPSPPGGSGGQHEDSEESGVGHEEEEEIQQLIIELLSNIGTPKVSEIVSTSAVLKWSPPVKDQGDPKFEALDHITEESEFKYEVRIQWMSQY